MPPAAPKFDFRVLRRLREQHNLTLAELSKASRVSTAVISKLERNQQSAELDTLYRLARAFRFRQVKYANVVALLGAAPAGAKVSRPEIHHDDTEVCWVTAGRLRLT